MSIKETLTIANSNAINRSVNDSVLKETNKKEDYEDDNYRTEEMSEKQNTKTKEEGFSTHPLFSHGMCRWTGCEIGGFKTLDSFREHLTKDHILDERSTAQTRVQVRMIQMTSFSEKCLKSNFIYIYIYIM